MPEAATCQKPPLAEQFAKTPFGQFEYAAFSGRSGLVKSFIVLGHPVADWHHWYDLRSSFRVEVGLWFEIA